MKKTGLHILFLCLCISICNSEPSDTNKGNITVSVEGCELKEGKIIIALLNSKKSYLSLDVRPYQYTYLRHAYSYTFKNVPYGTYALQLYYDENDNDKLDTSFGIPREKYGFSNNARKYFSKPSYREVCFPLRQAVVTQHIILK